MTQKEDFVAQLWALKFLLLTLADMCDESFFVCFFFLHLCFLFIARVLIQHWHFLPYMILLWAKAVYYINSLLLASRYPRRFWKIKITKFVGSVCE
jgi:hypothetical protein